MKRNRKSCTAKESIFMDIAQFAEKHRVKIQRDGCGDPIISGKAGHIGDGYDGNLGVCVMLETKMLWTYAKKALVAAGMTIKQDTDTEGVAVFNPLNWKQARLALKVARVRTRRNAALPSQAQLAARPAFAGRRRNALQSV